MCNPKSIRCYLDKEIRQTPWLKNVRRLLEIELLSGRKFLKFQKVSASSSKTIDDFNFSDYIVSLLLSHGVQRILIHEKMVYWANTLNKISNAMLKNCAQKWYHNFLFEVTCIFGKMYYLIRSKFFCGNNHKKYKYRILGYFQLVRKPKVVIPPPPPPPVGDLGDKSFLNIWMDTINRQHSKHKSMYTFVCGQQFRRDEHGKGNEHYAQARRSTPAVPPTPWHVS